LNQLKFIFILLFATLLFSSGLHEKPTCTKCDIATLASIENVSDSLDVSMLNSFLCTFDKSCKSNKEYLKRSNALLFKVLLNNPNLFLMSVTISKFDEESIKKSIQNPLVEVDFQKVYDAIKSASFKSSKQKAYLEVIKTSATKNKVVIVD